MLDRLEPLSHVEAKKLIGEIVLHGSVTPSQHALDELENDGMTMVDAVNVLKGGYVESSEERQGTWRYRVRTARMVVVIAFRSATELRIVTAWRIKR